MPGPAVMSTGPSGEAMAFFWLSLALPKSKPPNAACCSAVGSSSSRTFVTGCPPSGVLPETRTLAVSPTISAALAASPPGPLFTLENCEGAEYSGTPDADTLTPIVPECSGLYKGAPAALNPPVSVASFGSSTRGTGFKRQREARLRLRRHYAVLAEGFQPFGFIKLVEIRRHSAS